MSDAEDPLNEAAALSADAALLDSIFRTVENDLASNLENTNNNAQQFSHLGRLFCITSILIPFITWTLLFAGLPERVVDGIWALTFCSTAVGSLGISIGIALLHFASRLRTHANTVLFHKIRLHQLEMACSLDVDEDMKAKIYLVVLEQLLRINEDKTELGAKPLETDESVSFRALMLDVLKQMQGK